MIHEHTTLLYVPDVHGSRQEVGRKAMKHRDLLSFHDLPENPHNVHSTAADVLDMTH